MPTYAYACRDCGHDFEVVQSFTDDSLTVCPVCAGQLRKVFANVGVVFKGSGFYRTDSRGPDTSGDKSSAASADKGSSTPAEKSSDKGSGEKPAAKSGEKSSTPAAAKSSTATGSGGKTSGSGSGSAA